MSDQSSGRHDEALLLKTVSTPPNYMPKIMPIKQGFFKELRIFLADGWRYMAVATLVWLVLLGLFLLSFNPAP